MTDPTNDKHKFTDRRGVHAATEAADTPGNDDEDKYLRLAADFENFKRRKAQELADRARYASEEAALALLPVLDNLHRAMEHAPTGGDSDNFVEGLQIVMRDFESALERLGVQPIEAVGEPFDPVLHEAIGGEELDDVDVDTVAMELQKGYTLHDKVLRPAMVRVAHPRAGTPAKTE